jgi:hypothetical protein
MNGHRDTHALATGHDAAVQMIDTSGVLAHQHKAYIAGYREEHMGRSRGGFTSKIQAVVDAAGLPVQLGLPTGELMTTGSAWSYWRDCSRNQCCW